MVVTGKDHLSPQKCKNRIGLDALGTAWMFFQLQYIAKDKDVTYPQSNSYCLFDYFFLN